jgi:hypothetical protein
MYHPGARRGKLWRWVRVVVGRVPGTNGKSLYLPLDFTVNLVL